MPPPARRSPKANPMSQPEGAVAQKPGGPQDVLSSETAKAELARKEKTAAFWSRAYEAKVRAEHGSFFNEELLIEKRPKYQKWQVLVCRSDVLEKNSATRLRTHDYLKGERAHSSPKPMFKELKEVWEKLDEAERKLRTKRMQDDIKTAKELEAQKKRKAAEEKRRREEEALFDVNAAEESDRSSC